MHGKILTLLAALASFLCASMPVFADSLPEKHVSGIDETRDSLSLESLRDYLSMIREKRPTVALVLSGGGAKGASTSESSSVWIHWEFLSMWCSEPAWEV